MCASCEAGSRPVDSTPGRRIRIRASAELARSADRHARASTQYIRCTYLAATRMTVAVICCSRLRDRTHGPEAAHSVFCVRPPLEQRAKKTAGYCRRSGSLGSRQTGQVWRPAACARVDRRHAFCTLRTTLCRRHMPHHLHHRLLVMEMPSETLLALRQSCSLRFVRRFSRFQPPRLPSGNLKS